jgi:glycosyltransferase involved in cell wall biosynthesis
VFAALPLRLARVRVILDLHEAMPELFRTRFPRAASRTVQWLLRVQERASIDVSTVTITTTNPMRDRLVRLGVRPSKLFIVRNVPSLERFDPGQHPVRGFAQDGVVRLVYAGALTPIYELDVAIRAIALLVGRGVRVELDVYGRGDTADELEALARDLGVDVIVRFHGRIALEAVAAEIARADIGIAPTTLDSFTALTLSGKVYEYAAMGKPVVASRLPLVEESFPAGSIAIYEPGDPSSMAAAIERFIDDPADRDARVRAAGAAVRASGWEIEGAAYVRLVERLAAD